MTERLAERLLALEDREAIRELIARYGPLADAGHADAIAALWTDQGVYAVGGMGESVGHAAIAALIDGATHRSLMADGCAHVLSAPAIELCGDEATAWCHSIVLRHAENGWEPVRVAANRWQLVRVEAVWRVARRDNQLLDGSAEAQALFNLPTDRHQPPAVLP